MRRKMAGPWFSLALVCLVALATPLEGQPAPRYRAWVHLTDKGISSPQELAEAIRAVEAGFDRRALHRRQLRRTLPGLFDERDIPLHEPYVEEIAAQGVTLGVRSRWLNGIGVTGITTELQAVEALPFVREVTDLHPEPTSPVPPGRIPRDPDLHHGPPLESSDPFGWSSAQIRQINLNPLHEAGFRGHGIRIGVIDTGFITTLPAFTHPAGPLRVHSQWDFVENDSSATLDPGDDHTDLEHGTLILGALAANIPGGLVGSAPEAEYILLRAEDSDSEFFLEERWFVAALEFAEAHGADVVSSSVVLYEGYDQDDVDGRTSVMAQGWALAVGNGIVGLQGGGNSGHDDDPSTHSLLPPAGVPGVITVGAVTSHGEAARFSSDGFALDGTVKPELLARGQNTESVSPYVPGAYTTSNGTSMATPVLAGAVACLLQINPDWSVSQVREALFFSGDHFQAHGTPDPLFIRGYGIPDLAKAARLNTGQVR